MKKGLLVLLTLLIAPVASADLVSVYGGIGAWRQGYSGDVGYGTPRDEIDVDKELGIDDKTHLNMYVGVEHFVPFVPNFKLAHSRVESDGSEMVNATFVFGGNTYTVGRQVDTTVDFSHTDLVFYYKVLELPMELDLGINVRIIDGEVSILSPADNTTVPPTPLVSGEQSFTLPIPMVYGRARFDLPMTNFYGVGEMNFIGYSGNKLTDIKIGAGYESDLGFGAEVGFRSMRLTIDDVDDVDADVDIKGIYAGVTFSF